MEPWTDKEEEILRELYPDNGSKWDGWRHVLPNRTRGQITLHARDLGIKMSKEARSRLNRLAATNRRDNNIDPNESVVVRMMNEGKPLSLIDKQHHWYPGTAKRVLLTHWERVGV